LHSQIASLNNETASDTRQLLSLQTNASAAASKIASLQSTVSSDSSLIATLQATNSSAAAEIRSLEANLTSTDSQITVLTGIEQQAQANIGSLETELGAEISNVGALGAKVASLDAAFVAGNFTETAACPNPGNCSYAIDGAYANFGTSVANDTNVTFSFYSGPSRTGQTLCTTTVALGTVSGRSVGTLTQQMCLSTSTTSAQSFGWTFAHT
jgi:hypothetical protein